jgi:hypothetical protein
MTTKELLESYYKGFAEKSNWESVLSDNFKFIGGDLKKNDSNYFATLTFSLNSK